MCLLPVGRKKRFAAVLRIGPVMFFGLHTTKPWSITHIPGGRNVFVVFHFLSRSALMNYSLLWFHRIYQIWWCLNCVGVCFAWVLLPRLPLVLLPLRSEEVKRGLRSHCLCVLRSSDKEVWYINILHWEEPTSATWITSFIIAVDETNPLTLFF